MSASEPPVPESRITRSDRTLWVVGVVVAMGLAIALWSQAGREVFSAMMGGLLALCF